MGFFIALLLICSESKLVCVLQKDFYLPFFNGLCAHSSADGQEILLCLTLCRLGSQPVLSKMAQCDAT